MFSFCFMGQIGIEFSCDYFCSVSENAVCSLRCSSKGCWGPGYNNCVEKDTHFSNLIDNMLWTQSLNWWCDLWCHDNTLLYNWRHSSIPHEISGPLPIIFLLLLVFLLLNVHNFVGFFCLFHNTNVAPKYSLKSMWQFVSDLDALVLLNDLMLWVHIQTDKHTYMYVHLYHQVVPGLKSGSLKF